MRTKLATATRWAAQRPRTDQQGIALQTVIVIVVMLVIAGGVSGVLLSRGGDVISDLESADVNASEINTDDECLAAGRSLTGVTISALSSVSSAGTGAAAGYNGTTCTVADARDGNMTQFNCEGYRSTDGSRGVFMEQAASPATTGSLCTIG